MRGACKVAAPLSHTPGPSKGGLNIGSKGMDHPNGLPPPGEWWTEQGGRATAAQFQGWLKRTQRDKPKKRGKFNQAAGWYEDLGIHLRSLLEANTLRLLKFLGYQLWTDKANPPPPTDRHVAYERTKYRLVYKAGKSDERPLFYLPDWHLWTDGALSIWESKGLLDQRSKRLLRLMEAQHMPVVLITAEELDARKAEALYAARRRGEMVLEIPRWNEGPKEAGGDAT